jgi:hypothetical protein
MAAVMEVEAEWEPAEDMVVTGLTVVVMAKANLTVACVEVIPTWEMDQA